MFGVEVRVGFVEHQQFGVACESGGESDPATLAALVDLCLALFNANEFVYLD